MAARVGGGRGSGEHPAKTPDRSTTPSKNLQRAACSRAGSVVSFGMVIRIARFVDGPHAGKIEAFHNELPSMLTREVTFFDEWLNPWRESIVYERDRYGLFRAYRTDKIRRGFGIGPYFRL